ncbi:hypothetical protein HPP92_012102 [Vanilla planifolia]|uniref:Uncharacterized protein n=1 Tax=Vanilla planifolia TaxID=51239 RepID=A0A835R5F8_VANPL|nr:hypothetical protein HPP92_012102 [Vanilla planifolia]
MEGKKKKNKKKKANHTKSSDSIPTVEENQTRPMVTMSSTDKPFPNNEHGSHGDLNHHGDAPSNVDSQSIEVSESDLQQARCRNLETLCGQLQAEVRRLEEEKDTWSQKEGSLEEKISSLQNKVDFCIQRETKLEEKIDILQNSNASLALQEVILEEKVRKIEGVESWALEQVRELRASRDGLAHENELLTESISTLASRVERLEMAAFDASLKILEEKLHADATYAIVEQDDKKSSLLRRLLIYI